MKHNSIPDFDLPLGNPSLNNTEIPELDTQTANQLLNNVLEACDMEPSSIPVEVLESWGNYQKPAFDLGKFISYTFLVLMILLPLLFFHPNIAAKRVNVDSATDAVYDIDIQTLMPVKSISATLNNKPISLISAGDKQYSATVSENGTLSITAETLNGQKTTKTYKVSHIDTEKPQFISSYTQENRVYLVIQDTYSGINYDGITGLTPLEYDKDTSTIAFEIPPTPQTVTIPDYAGNELTLLISPIETNN